MELALGAGDQRPRARPAVLGLGEGHQAPANEVAREVLLGHRHLAAFPTLPELVEVRHEHVTPQDDIQSEGREQLVECSLRGTLVETVERRGELARRSHRREAARRRRPRGAVARPPRPRTRGRGSRASPGRARRRPRRRGESLPVCDSARAARTCAPRRGGTRLALLRAVRARRCARPCPLRRVEGRRVTTRRRKGGEHVDRRENARGNHRSPAPVARGTRMAGKTARTPRK